MPIPRKGLIGSFALIYLLIGPAILSLASSSKSTCNIDLDSIWKGRTILSQFRITDRVGRGGLGFVYKATQIHPLVDGFTLAVAVKVPVLPDEEGRNVLALTQERDALVLLNAAGGHPGIQRLIHHHVTDNPRDTFLVTALHDAETLQDAMQNGKPMTLTDILVIGTQMAEALQFSPEFDS